MYLPNLQYDADTQQYNTEETDKKYNEQEEECPREKFHARSFPVGQFLEQRDF